MITLEQQSVIAWILNNRFTTESGEPIEFIKHKYLIDYLHDDHPDKVAPKAAQVGATVAETLDEIHKAYYFGLNTIHTLQNSDVIRGFVQPKVNPIIYNNEPIRNILKSDSENIKQFGKGFVFYRGAQAVSQAINISADILKIDEMDRSNQQVVEMFQSRLDAAKARGVQPKYRRFSNPSAMGFGVDALWQNSNQFHWMVKCQHCGHRMYMDWESDDLKCHYVNRDEQFFACGNCHKEISNYARITGEWVAKYASRTNRHGYWFTQLMVSWFTAEDIIKKFEENSTDYFYNFVLGKAYTPADLRLDRDTILKNTKPTTNIMKGVVMGTDVGKPHWYWLATPSGYFRYGKTDSWDELEYIYKMHQCEAWVIDAMPEFTMVGQMIAKYPGKVFGCYFKQDSKNIGAIQWGTGDKKGIVYADRTKVIDRYVNDISTGAMPFNMKHSEMDEFIAHAANIYRSVETDDKGNIKVNWKTTDNKPDHLVFAGLYARIALERVFNASNAGVVIKDKKGPQAKLAPVIQKTKQKPNIMIQFDVEESLKRAQKGVQR